ncbi:MAG TPA: WD40 repeat domain-containing protein [Bryobacteraceae bacterium]|jgi:hypothetical protein
MKLVLLVFLCGRLGLAAQASQAAVRIGAPNAGSRSGQSQDAVGAAVLGFLPGPGPLELSAIFGVFGAARLGDPIAAPKAAIRLYVSTGQQYALVEQSSDAPLAVWDPTAQTGELTAIPGALPHPDLLTFSPRGDSAALYARESGQIQVISGMPNQPVVRKSPPLLSPSAASMMAVSDDANVVIVRDSAGNVLISNDGKNWQAFSGAYSPLAWTFVPKTHDLIVGDKQENAIFLLEQAGSNSARIILSENALPDHISVTRDGQTLVALDSKRGILWTIDLKRRIASGGTAAANLHSLSILRGVNTFLASSQDASVTLLRVSEAAGVQMSVLPKAGGR